MTETEHENRAMAMLGWILLIICFLTLPDPFDWKSALTGVLAGEACVFFTFATKSTKSPKSPLP